MADTELVISRFLSIILMMDMRDAGEEGRVLIMNIRGIMQSDHVRGK